MTVLFTGDPKHVSLSCLSQENTSIADRNDTYIDYAAQFLENAPPMSLVTELDCYSPEESTYPALSLIEDLGGGKMELYLLQQVRFIAQLVYSWRMTFWRRPLWNKLSQILFQMDIVSLLKQIPRATRCLW